MSSYKNPNQIRQRSGFPLDRKMDKWIQTGRQVVDGVAGNRPGQRRGGRKDKEASVNLEKVGRWMEEKIDWFFEDDDDWPDSENLDGGRVQENINDVKRPLSAISLRAPKALPSQIEPRRMNSDELDEWPDEESFKLNKWERKDNITGKNESNLKDSFSVGQPYQRRKNIPRSSRRKY